MDMAMRAEAWRTADPESRNYCKAKRVAKGSTQVQQVSKWSSGGIRCCEADGEVVRRSVKSPAATATKRRGAAV